MRTIWRSRAGELGVDFAVLGPVRPTASHPDASPLGWEGFGRAVATTPVPVYALGGLDLGDLAQATRHGAPVFAQRSAWKLPVYARRWPPPTKRAAPGAHGDRRCGRGLALMGAVS